MIDDFGPAIKLADVLMKTWFVT